MKMGAAGAKSNSLPRPGTSTGRPFVVTLLLAACLAFSLLAVWVAWPRAEPVVEHMTQGAGEPMADALVGDGLVWDVSSSGAWTSVTAAEHCGAGEVLYWESSANAFVCEGDGGGR